MSHNEEWVVQTKTDSSPEWEYHQMLSFEVSGGEDSYADAQLACDEIKKSNGPFSVVRAVPLRTEEAIVDSDSFENELLAMSID